MKIAVALLALLCVVPSSFAACDKDGTRTQMVFARSGANDLGYWTVKEGEIHSVTLPNGVLAGVSLGPVDGGYFAAVPQGQDWVVEIAKVRVYDLANGADKPVATIYGGTNSIQTFRADGGSARVAAFGDPGLTLTLLNPVCVRVYAAAPKK